MDILENDFFNRSSVKVARDLIGKFLVRKIGKKVEKYLITETEGYEGFEDRASHAHKSKGKEGRTERNFPMFGEPGTIYVYFTYGMHYMLNIVCGPNDYPAAVLIRGIFNMEEGKEISGPGRVTKRLEIDKNLNNKILGKKVGLWIEYKKEDINNGKIKVISTPRIGINSSGPVWSKKPWRFLLKIDKT